MNVVWTDEAKAHLQDIYHYIRRDSPVYAARTVDGLTRRAEQLTTHPRSGRVMPKYDDEDLRELVVYPYRLVYRIKTDRIDVIAVFHGARQPPESL